VKVEVASVIGLEKTIGIEEMWVIGTNVVLVQTYEGG
jgi:hypothetical protein